MELQDYFERTLVLIIVLVDSEKFESPTSLGGHGGNAVTWGKNLELEQSSASSLSYLGKGSKLSFLACLFYL